MLTRRQYLTLCAAAGVTVALRPKRLRADDTPRALITRAIPGTDELLPVVGLGSSASFSRMAGAGDISGVRDVLDALIRHGGTVFDTAPSYGAAEHVAATVARETGWNDRLFWATKVNVAGWGGDAADPERARAQIEQSITWLGKPAMDLIQVHNLGDVPTQLGLLKTLRDAGRVRYIGVTTTFPRQYQQLEQIMRAEPLDFIGVDYAVDNRVMEERIFPLALDRGIAVLCYQPFGRRRLWERVEGQPLPDWAADYDIATWAQFFLKFSISHPAVTSVTPATSRVRHVIDNLGAAMGRVAGPERKATHD